MAEIETKLVAVDAAAPDAAVLAEAARIIRAGGLVAFPTETVYGLGADALSETAVRGIFAAKQRPAYDPIIVHIAAADDLPRVARAVPPVAAALAEAFWPGPLTLVLPRGAAVPDAITAGADTVAVRCPRHPVALGLIRAAGVPIGAPSANRFSHTSPTTARHVWDDLAGRIGLILDAGPTAVGVESTVLDVTGAVPVVLRPGGVPLEALRVLLPEVVLRRQMAPATAAAPSPGMLARHYAPRTELWLLAGEPAAVRRRMHEVAEREGGNGRRVALLLADEDLPFFNGTPLPLASVGPAARPEEVARRLFDAIRRLDALGADLILARDFAPAGLGLAVADRLRRAARRVIEVGVRS